MSKTSDQPWFHAGLHFTCTQCGNCCTGAPGYVYVTSEEIEKIAAFIGRADGWLDKQHLRRVGSQYSLTENKKNGDCCFLKQENGKRMCTIYPVRPLQCRTWPFWDINLESSHDWNAAAKNCPGMNKGKHYDLVQIELRRDADRWEDVPQ